VRYPAIVTKDGKYTLAEFPDCPGCQTFVDAGESIEEAAAEALEGWMEASLEHGDAPLPPSRRSRAPAGATLLQVPVPPRIAAAIAVRWARKGAGLSQAALGAKIGVSQQAIAKLGEVLHGKRKDPRLATLAKQMQAVSVAEAAIGNVEKVGQQKKLNIENERAQLEDDIRSAEADASPLRVKEAGLLERVEAVKARL